jgi:hypothetical protein
VYWSQDFFVFLFKDFEQLSKGGHRDSLKRAKQHGARVGFLIGGLAIQSVALAARPKRRLPLR